MLLVDDPETIRIFKEKTQGENAGTQTIKIDDYRKSSSLDADKIHHKK